MKSVSEVEKFIQLNKQKRNAQLLFSSGLMSCALIYIKISQILSENICLLKLY
jgi:hypothetical protein